jgi:hypothetical protein
MANILGLHCSVLDEFGKLTIVIHTEENEIIRKL